MRCLLRLLLDKARIVGMAGNCNAVTTAEHLNNKGVLLANNRNPRSALKCFRRAAKILPQDTTILTNMATACAWMGKWEEVFSICEQMASQGQSTALLFNNVGAILERQGKTHLALLCYEQALRQDPRAPYIWQNRASCLITLDRPAEALDCLDQALSANPRWKSAWNLKAQVLHRLGRYPEVADCLNRALDLE